MSGLDPSSRHSKRSRKSDVTQQNNMSAERDRTKRRRTSRSSTPADENSMMSHAPKEAPICLVDSKLQWPQHTGREDHQAPHGYWSLSSLAAGRFTNIDPVITPDEQYICVGIDTGVNVYSVATSRLFRSLQLEPYHNVIGCNLDPDNSEHMYIFTSDGRVSKWDWPAAKELSHWETGSGTLSANLHSINVGNDAQLAVLSLREGSDGKKEVVLIGLNDGKPHETVILETKLQLEDVNLSTDGSVVIAYGGHHILLGITKVNSDVPETMQYSWREIVLPVSITCLDIHSSYTPPQTSDRKQSKGKTVDIVVGEPGGSILIYHDVLSIFMSEKSSEGRKNLSSRRLHWHRDPVSTVRWSRDGNYIISGGHETVMVLWQLDTGRKQFLPHLSSQICKIVVSGTGGAYLLKLADNSLMMLSARELQPFATITGLQLCPKKSMPAHSIPTTSTISAAAAALHPRYPDRLLIPVPSSVQLSPEGISSTDFNVLQTYDIHTDSHISRQALARTNATTLRVSPEGSRVDAPDVTHLCVSQDGKWMATVDMWNPCLRDTGILDPRNIGLNDGTAMVPEIFLKFWKWSDSTNLWELATRIEGPHFTASGPMTILDLSPRPQCHEFATFGSDAVLRFWCSSTRQRSGLTTESRTEPLVSWKCRNNIDLNGHISVDGRTSLKTASLSYSQDGSVLALCIETMSAVASGLVVIVDVQNCSIRYSRKGVYPGNLCSAGFLGCHLVIASQESISIWDTVNDSVRTTGTLDADDYHSATKFQLLAVNSRTQTFAVATSFTPSRMSGNPSKKFKSVVRVYDLRSLAQLCRYTLRQCPLLLASSPHSGDYIIVDANASVQRLGSARNASNSTRSQNVPLNSGLKSLFGSHARGDPKRDRPSTDVDISVRGQLASIFQEAPFVSPPASVLFRDVVHALSG